jgi:hypothetical protein
LPKFPIDIGECGVDKKLHTALLHIPNRFEVWI